MKINTAAIIGMGALGILYAKRVSENLPYEKLRIIADEKRIKRYRLDGLYCNGVRCDFNFVDMNEKGEPADIVIFAVKFRDLQDVVKAVSNQIGKQTIIISLLNGIISEEIIGKTYGMKNVVYCVAQGMDAVKTGNMLTYEHIGELCIGTYPNGDATEQVKAVADFFERMHIPYSVKTDMAKHLWGKFMLNVGVNQTVAVYEGNYGTVQAQGEARGTMTAAMQEVLSLSEFAQIDLTEKDITYWLQILDTLNPLGIPSMRQDTLAKRPTEVGLFSGTIIELGRRYGVATPVNQMLYDKIAEIEKNY